MIRVSERKKITSCRINTSLLRFVQPIWCETDIQQRGLRLAGRGTRKLQSPRRKSGCSSRAKLNIGDFLQKRAQQRMMRGAEGGYSQRDAAMQVKTVASGGHGSRLVELRQSRMWRWMRGALSECENVHNGRRCRQASVGQACVQRAPRGGRHVSWTMGRALGLGW